MPNQTIETPPVHKTEHNWLSGAHMPHHAPASPPQEPPSGGFNMTTLAPGESVPVTRVLSVRGVEYAMMTIALWFSATGLAWVLLNTLNGSAKFDFLVVPISVLITTLPVFGILFIRLKRAELANPALRMESSKRRCSQLTQVLAFLALLINGTVFVYNVLQKINDNSEVSIGKSLLNLAIIVVIAGGILAYYWFDEHRYKGA